MALVKKTSNKIKELIDPSSLDLDTRFVLINAIYFKATWKYQFEKKKTSLSRALRKSIREESYVEKIAYDEPNEKSSFYTYD